LGVTLLKFFAGLAAAGVIAASASGCGSSSSSSSRSVVKWYVFNEPSGGYKQAAANCSKGKPYRVEVVSLPTDANQQRELVVRRLAAKDSDIDIIGMDVIWTAEFAEAGWIRPWSASMAQQASQGVLPGPLATAKFQGRLWTAPFTSNTQLLWYRKDLVKTPPKTWAEMIAQARKLGAVGRIEEEGAKYEGLTVWFNSLIESAGGSILTPNGKPSLGPAAVQAANVMKQVASAPNAEPSLSNTKEDTARLAFQTGKAAFQINYPFIYASAQTDAKPFVPKIGWTRWPAVDANRPSRPPIGGINLGVSHYSKQPQRAFEAALCIAGPENQVIAAQKGGLPPTRASLYNDPRIAKAFPFADVLKVSIRDGAPRPATPAYSDVSLAVQDTLHPPGGIDPPKVPSELKSKLNAAIKGDIF
jgi:multiple sugar transport system substrate-binding protein